MTKSYFRTGAALVVAASVLAACASAPAASGSTPGTTSGATLGTASASATVTRAGVLSPAEQARADSGRPPFTAADVRFMQGMIGHHAQALVMAGMAASHGAGPAVGTLAGRIDVGQRDEIAMMQRWLRDRGQSAPDAEEQMRHAAMGHAMGDLMPGMLTPEQLAELDRARGAEFDRLFLTYMIRHHEGAVKMVHDLFAAHGAGQDITVFKLASDVEADQTTEIDRMQSMLAAMGAR